MGITIALSILSLFVVMAIVGYKLRKSCEHNWDVESEKTISVYSTDNNEIPIRYQRTIFYRCNKCGIHKVKKLKY